MTSHQQLIAATFDRQSEAESVLDSLQQMHRASNITLTDAAVVTRDDNDDVHVHETEELTTGKGAVRGAVVGALVGLVFPPGLIASTAVGGGAGALIGKLRDTGIKSDSIDEIAEHLDPGEYAVVALADRQYAAPIEAALASGRGDLVHQDFSDSESAVIEEVAIVE
jgi:uncharacterized membrane protein